MASSKWLDRTQPQTLYIAQILMYLNAALSLLDLLVFGFIPSVFLVVLIVGQVLGAWGIANEKKWAYWVAVVIAVAMLLLAFVAFRSTGIITLIFDVALVALLLHPQSRDYQRTWFR
jgi:hypothetical protein